MDPFSSYRCASAPLLEGLNLGTGTVLTETPLGGRSHFILFFRPIALSICALSSLPFQQPPVAAGSRQLQPTLPARHGTAQPHGTRLRHVPSSPCRALMHQHSSWLHATQQAMGPQGPTVPTKATRHPPPPPRMALLTPNSCVTTGWKPKARTVTPRRLPPTAEPTM